MNTQITQTKVVLGSTLRGVSKARRTGQLNLKAVKIANVIKKLRYNLINPSDCTIQLIKLLQ